MKVLVIIVLLLLILFVSQIKQPEPLQQPVRKDVPRYYPVYIDHSTEYLNEPILYSEWPQAPLEISSSL